MGSFLQQELEKIKTSYPTCTGFERNFPSLCFALATGVGKTRLMGAFVAYLYLSKGIKHYFVLAPNITIYNKLISLENPDNKIEIVIHVNMLKEGWDVTNLSTIIPLRTATSMTLREQTIGRGLRLPYGKRTGNDKVDKLTIVAHDKFQEIIDAAFLL